MDLGLSGKVAIVTGGSHGIGKAAAESFCREGAKVAIAARDQADLDAAASEIAQSTGGEIVGISTDMSQEEQVDRLVKAVVERWGRVDILVNNAGQGNANSLDDMTNDILRADIELKVFGAIYGMRAVRPHMQRQGGGAVLNITTAAGKASGPNGQPTALSRAALNGHKETVQFLIGQGADLTITNSEGRASLQAILGPAFIESKATGDD